ncbi:uncharacterized protein LOC117299280 isoform X1 [Asterias rubens]|uniref:uncharacterized protein LOC117299280 isoform X1 n=1 Tax=Asterias rubens TaxID=7604 RepID=UPI0014552DA1|nr:uncharacterized protein LOC117299280 isoform X1 [Asterias rubens]
MQLSTKKCILTYSGAVMFAFGFTLISVGKDYFNLPYSASASYDPPKVVRAIPHWCGVLLILLGARNFTFGLAQWKYGMNCCGNGACEVIFVNFMSLLVSLAAVGVSVYSSYSYLTLLSVDNAISNPGPEFVLLISMWFMGLISAILSLLSMCAGCLPVGSTEMDEEGLEMQQYGHDNTQFNKY